MCMNMHCTVRMLNMVGFLLIIKVSHVNSFSEPCDSSPQTIEVVKHCPNDTNSYLKAAARKNCGQQHVNCSSFEYHCVLNDHENETVEVCAPSIFIIGEVCAKFNLHSNSIFRIEGRRCNDPPCGYRYNSTQSYKYPGCFRIKQDKETLTTTQIPNSSEDFRSSVLSTEEYESQTSSSPDFVPDIHMSTSSPNSSLSEGSIVAIVIGAILAIIIILFILLICWKMKRRNLSFAKAAKAVFCFCAREEQATSSRKYNQGEAGTTHLLSPETPLSEVNIETDILPGQLRRGDSDTQSSPSAQSQSVFIHSLTQQTIQSENGFHNVQPPSISSSSGLDIDGAHVTPPEDITDIKYVSRQGSEDEPISNIDSTELLLSDESQPQCAQKSGVNENRNAHLSVESDKTQSNGLHSPQKAQHSQGSDEITVLNRANDSNKMLQSEENQHQVASPLSEISKSASPNTVEQDNSQDAFRTLSDLQSVQLGIQVQSPPSHFTSEPSDNEVAVQAPLPLPNGSNQTHSKIENTPTISLRAARQIDRKSLSEKLFTRAEGNQKGIEETRDIKGGFDSEVDEVDDSKKSSQGGPVVERGNSGDDNEHISNGIVQESHAESSALSDTGIGRSNREQQGATGGQPIRIGKTDPFPEKTEEEAFGAKEHEKICNDSEEIRILKVQMKDVISILNDTVRRQEFHMVQKKTKELEVKIENLQSELRRRCKENEELKKQLEHALKHNKDNIALIESLKRELQDKDAAVNEQTHQLQCVKQDHETILKKLQKYIEKYGELKDD